MLQLRNCRICRAPFEPRDHQVRRGDYACPACRSVESAAWRRRRAAAGNPVPKSPRSPERPETVAARFALYRRDPEKRARMDARSNARRAIREGRLTRQPCEICGATKVEAHHDDYSRPLDVRWLCRPHHREHHAQLAAANLTERAA